MKSKKRKVRKMKKPITDKTSHLNEAIKDLEAEISKLKSRKINLKREMQETLSEIDVDRERESKLQQKIARLMEKEAKLNQKKKNLQSNMDKLSDKMSKITKIKSEMADI